MSTDKPPAWQTAVFTGSPRDNITPYLATRKAQIENPLFYGESENASYSKTIPGYQNWLDGNYTEEMYRELFPTRNDNSLSREKIVAPDGFVVQSGSGGEYGPLTDERIRQTFFQTYLTYPSATDPNVEYRGKLTAQDSILDDMRSFNGFLYGASVQDVARAIGSTPQALINWFLAWEGARYEVDAINFTVKPTAIGYGPNSGDKEILWATFVKDRPLTFKQSVPDAYPNQPVNTQNNLVVLPSSTSTTAAGTAAAPTQGPVIPNNNVTEIPTTPAVTITNQNTNNPPPSYTFQKLDGSTYTITINEWISFSPVQQALWLRNKGFTDKDLIFAGFSDAAIRRYDDQLIDAGITATLFEQNPRGLLPPEPAKDINVTAVLNFIFGDGRILAVPYGVDGGPNWTNFTLKQKAQWLNDNNITPLILLTNAFTLKDIKTLQDNGYLITQNDLDKLNGLGINTSIFESPENISTEIENTDENELITDNTDVEDIQSSLTPVSDFDELEANDLDEIESQGTSVDDDNLTDTDDEAIQSNLTTVEDDYNLTGTDDEAIQSNLTTVEDDDNLTYTDNEKIQSSLTTVDDDNTDNLGTVDDDAVESVEIPLIDTSGYLKFQDELDKQIENGKAAPYSGTNTRGITGAVSNTRAQADLQYAINFSTLDDWRVRLKLAPESKYFYNANASERGILAPLNPTEGIIFPYTPQISVNYIANYDTTNPTHSNYKILQYQNSAVESFNLSCDFTAQDTKEANYLLAVIHFLRSVTKMFYGQDENPKRGTPPPLCYLEGLGEFQFDKHPLVITSFSYSLPDDVDYIRSMISGSNPGTQQNNSGQGGSSASTNRLAGTGVDSSGNAPAVSFSTPTTGQMSQPTYVPTKIKISINCMPVVSRKDISDTFSLKAYANGSLLRGSKRNGGGIW